MAKALGFHKEEDQTLVTAEKKGRVISEANYNKIKTAYDALGEVLTLAEQERAIKAKEADIDMTPEELKQLVAEMVAEALAEQMKSQQDEKEKPEEQQPKQQQEEEKPKQEEQQPKQDEEDETEKLIKALEQRIAILEKSRYSRRLFGQDGGIQTAVKSINTDRDPFGRKIN